MRKKYWKQIATVIFAFILIFQNSATTLMATANSTNGSVIERDTPDTSIDDTTGQTSLDQETSQDESSNGEEATTTNTESSTTEDTQEIGDTTVIIDGDTYDISNSFTQEQIPAYFSLTTIDYNGNTVTALKLDNGELYLLYLVEQGTYSGNFYIYNQESKIAYPFRTTGNDENYLIFLNTPEDATAPEGFAETSLFLEGNTIPTYRFDSTLINSTDQEESVVEDTSSTLSMADFYLVYGMSSRGYEGWFQYDAGESTYLRYVSYDVEDDKVEPEELEAVKSELNSITQKYSKDMSNRLFIISGLIILVFILIIIITGLLFKVKDLKSNDNWDDDDDDDWNDDYDYEVSDDDDYLNTDSEDEQEEAADENDYKDNIENSKESEPVVPSENREKDRTLAKDITPGMDVNRPEAIMDESELAKEVAKAMKGKEETSMSDGNESDDNFNFEYVDLD